MTTVPFNITSALSYGELMLRPYEVIVSDAQSVFGIAYFDDMAEAYNFATWWESRHGAWTTEVNRSKEVG